MEEKGWVPKLREKLNEPKDEPTHLPSYTRMEIHNV